jgi:tRNA threonylcarbamoyl adenosine modification protein YjeE
VAGPIAGDASHTAELVLADLAATRAFARRLAATLKPGDVVGLRGVLGIGKTELARALIQARAAALIEVPSPSFTLVQDYTLGGLTIRHIDLYRIEDASELVELGLDSPAENEAWLIEWPERAGALLPGDRLDVTLTPDDSPDGRVVSLDAGPSWRARLAKLTGERPAERPSDRRS